VDIILEEKKKILMSELKDFRRGLFFFYFDTLDIVQHMFWRYIDSGHPLYEAGSKYRETIFEYYGKIDQVLGEVLEGLGQDTVLIVLSDHGFSSFRRAVHLNRWLLENGFLSLKEGVSQAEEFFEGVDWSNTRAYALGFGGIYLNRAGREGKGIVTDAQVAGLKREISARLKAWRDPQTNDAVVKNVYFSEEVFAGPYSQQAPDLFVGFNAGYRASWQTALGGLPQALIEDNRKRWSGDHLIDSALVPGVIFANKELGLDQPGIVDIAPLVLGLFDIDKPQRTPRESFEE
jgi:predicted AlkP superfamily phosphohydrolase/phosphomutase